MERKGNKPARKKRGRETNQLSNLRERRAEALVSSSSLSSWLLPSPAGNVAEPNGRVVKLEVLAATVKKRKKHPLWAGANKPSMSKTKSKPNKVYDDDG